MNKYFEPNSIIPTPAVRKWIYSVLAALVPIAVFYRLFTGEEAAMWIAVAAVFLGVGGNVLAAANTPKKVEVEEPIEDLDAPTAEEIDAKLDAIEASTGPQEIPEPVQYETRKARIDAEGN